jgi:hypothetical protein
MGGIKVHLPVKNSRRGIGGKLIKDQRVIPQCLPGAQHHAKTQDYPMEFAILHAVVSLNGCRSCLEA